MDPSGNKHEAFYGPELSNDKFKPEGQSQVFELAL